MSKVRSGTRTRLLGVAFLMAVAAGCGGGGSEDSAPGGPTAPVPAPIPAPAPVSDWGIFPEAAVVLGQTDFDQIDPQGTPATPVPVPVGGPAVTEDGTLYVAVAGGIVAFNPYDATNGPVATATLDVRSVSGLSAQGPRLVAATTAAVHIFNSVADIAAGDPNVFTGGFGCDAVSVDQPRSAYLTPQGQLIVADSFNSRVLIWNTVPVTGQLGEADVVLGQESPNTCDENRGGLPDRGTMSFPWSVWSDGVRLVVADTGNNRVLIWDSFPTAADPESLMPKYVLGQGSFTEADSNRGMDEPSSTSLNWPSSVDVSAEGQLAVVDGDNNRVLIWTSLPARDTEPAAYVIGQSDFVHGAANDPDQSGQDGNTPSAKTLSFPDGVRFHGRNLIVVDNSNSRVLVWRPANN